MTEEKPKSEEVLRKPKSNKSWMVATIVLVVLLVAGAVYAVTAIRNQNNKIKNLNSQVSDLQNKKKVLEDAATAAAKVVTQAVADNAATSSDQSMIAAALKAQCAEKYTSTSSAGPDVKQYTIKSIAGNYAQANYECKGADEGPEVILVKQNGNWNVVAAGLGLFVSDAVRSLYNIPASLPKY